MWKRPPKNFYNNTNDNYNMDMDMYKKYLVKVNHNRLLKIILIF